MKIPKNFTQDYFDAIENLEKVTQVQWKSFSSLFYNLHPPCFAQKILEFCTFNERKKIKSKKIWKEKHETNLMHCVPQESFLNYTAAIYYQRLRNSGLVSEFLSNKKYLFGQQ